MGQGVVYRDGYCGGEVLARSCRQKGKGYRRRRECSRISGQKKAAKSPDITRIGMELSNKQQNSNLQSCGADPTAL